MPDISKWEKYITVPDPETWDWAGAYEKQKDALADPTLFTTVTFGSCLFERLIAVMDFENAAMALVDDDQTFQLAEAILLARDSADRGETLTFPGREKGSK